MDAFDSCIQRNARNFSDANKRCLLPYFKFTRVYQDISEYKGYLNWYTRISIAVIDGSSVCRSYRLVLPIIDILHLRLSINSKHGSPVTGPVDWVSIAIVQLSRAFRYWVALPIVDFSVVVVWNWVSIHVAQLLLALDDRCAILDEDRSSVTGPQWSSVLVTQLESLLVPRSALVGGSAISWGSLRLCPAHLVIVGRTWISQQRYLTLLSTFKHTAIIISYAIY